MLQSISHRLTAVTATMTINQSTPSPSADWLPWEVSTHSGFPHGLISFITISTPWQSSFQVSESKSISRSASEACDDAGPRNSLQMTMAQSRSDKSKRLWYQKRGVSDAARWREQYMFIRSLSLDFVEKIKNKDRMKAPEDKPMHH